MNNFNSNNNDFRVDLTSVQGKLELLDSLDSKSNFISSKRSRTCTSSCIYDMVNGSNSDDYGFIPLQPLGRFLNRETNCNLNMGYVDMQVQLS